MIDLVLAGDNAIVIGLAAAGLPAEQRKQAILIGVIAATVLRIVFAAVTLQLLADPRPAAGRRHAAALGVLEDVARAAHLSRASSMLRTEALADADHDKDGDDRRQARRARRSCQAAWQIVIADVSMSLDNVLAVAGAARDHPTVLVFGLVLSIALMGIAANFIARLLHRYPLDRLCRPGDHPLRRARHDLSRRRRSLACGHLMPRACADQLALSRAGAGNRLDLHRVRRHLHELDAVAVRILDPALTIVVGAHLRLDGQLDAALAQRGSCGIEVGAFQAEMIDRGPRRSRRALALAVREQLDELRIGDAQIDEPSVPSSRLSRIISAKPSVSR